MKNVLFLMTAFFFTLITLLTNGFAQSKTDTTAPTGTVIINNGASSTDSPSVTLYLSATDDRGVTGYYVSESFTKPSASDSGWTSITSTTSYSESVSYTLSSGDGNKTVYVWYKDAAGNVSDESSDSITLATTSATPTPTPATTKTPTVTTGSTTNVTSGSATLNGTVNANGLSTTAWFEYGKTSGSYNNTSSTESVTGSNDTSLSIGINGLSAGTKYYYKLVAKNSAGTSYGSQNTFTTTSVSATPTPTPFTGGNAGVLELSKSYAYLNGDSIVVTVTDADLNTSSGGKDSTTVNVKSSADSTSVALTLTETASNTSTFSGTFSTAKSTDISVSPVKVKAVADGYITVKYSDSNPGSDITKEVTTKNFGAYLSITADEIELDDNATVSLYDPESNTSITSTNNVNIRIKSSSDSTGTTLSLTETGKDTGSFSGTINVSSNNTEKNNNILADVGDTITVSFTDSPDADGYVSVVTDTATVIDTSSIPVPSPTATPATSETGAVNGFVTDTDTGMGIAGATVRNQSGVYTATTGADGSYSIENVEAGNRTFTASATGYTTSAAKSVTVTAGETTTLDFALVAAVPTSPTPTPTTYSKDDFEVINSLVTDISTNDFENKYSGCKTPPENTNFCDGDKRVSLWFHYKNAKKGDAHVSEWYTPGGDLHLTDNESYGFKDGCWKISMRVRNGMFVGSELGEWQIKVYRNEELIFTEKFTINECIIYGTVMDTFEEPIESVKLKLKSKKGKPKIKENTHSEEDGYFEFTNLKRGVYELKARKNGYRKLNKKIEISAGEDNGVDLVLEEK